MKSKWLEDWRSVLLWIVCRCASLDFTYADQWKSEVNSLSLIGKIVKRNKIYINSKSSDSINNKARRQSSNVRLLLVLTKTHQTISCERESRGEQKKSREEREKWDFISNELHFFFALACGHKFFFISRATFGKIYSLLYFFSSIFFIRCDIFLCVTAKNTTWKKKAERSKNYNSMNWKKFARDRHCCALWWWFEGIRVNERGKTKIVGFISRCDGLTREWID